MSNDIKENPKKFWSFHSIKTKTRKLPNAIKKDIDSDSYAVEALEKANLFNDYFNTVFNEPVPDPPPPGIYPITPNLGELSSIALSVAEVESALKNLDPSKSPGPDGGITSRLLKEVATEIASSITIISNKSLAYGIFSSKWKDSNFVPVHKCSQKDIVKHYRGIALLSVLSKVFERCVYPRIFTHVEPLLNNDQHGFRRHRSCITQLLQYVHNLATTLDSGGQIDNIYLDMAKAFDRVPHQKLLYKLEYIGIRDPLLHWFKDYVTDRRHRVVIDGAYSDWKYVHSGVPQGSIIGPIMFLIYINDIGSGLSPDTSLPLYADDAKCSRVIENAGDCCILQEDINFISRWSEIWDMDFNLKKCKSLSITKKRNPITTVYKLGVEDITISKEEKDLGLLLNHKLSWHDHVLNKINTANKVLRLIKRTCGKQTHPKVILKLYIHLVRPHLEYASEVWSPHQIYLKDMIESVQRRATKLVIKNKSYDERLQDLKLLSLSSRRIFKDLMFLFKCLLGHYDLDLTKYMEPADNSTYNLRHSECSFKIKYARTNALKFSYFFRVVKSWNALPLPLRKSNTIREFRLGLESYLLTTDPMSNVS